MLDLNITMLFQFVNFIVAIFVLNILLIRPVREIIKKRNAIMDGLAGDADNVSNEARAKLANYEAELARAHAEGTLTREEARKLGLGEQDNILGKAQQSARELLDKNRATINGEAEAALTALRDGIDDFSAKLGQKLLG